MNKEKKIVADSDKQLYGDESDKLKRLKKGNKTATVIDVEEQPGPAEIEEQPTPGVRGASKKLIDTELSR